MTENNETAINKKVESLEPNMTDIFETYCLWKSLPSIFKYPPKDRKTGIAPSAREFCELMGIDNDEVLDLVDIKTQGEFAERFNISKDTVSRWNKTRGVRESLDDIRKWGRGLTKNVIASLYNTAVRKGGMMEVKLWAQLIEGWEEKSGIKHEGTDLVLNVLLKHNNGKDKPDNLGLNGKTEQSL
jgi:transcriptional regulator with XRE-family HTH domain